MDQLVGAQPPDGPVPHDVDLHLHLEAMASALDLVTAELDEAPNAPGPLRAPLRWFRGIVRRLMGRVLGRQTKYNLANYELSRYVASRLTETPAQHSGGQLQAPTMREELLGHDALILQVVKKRLDTLAEEGARHDIEIASQLRALDDRLARLEHALSVSRADRSSDQTGPH